jgi:hypothetical protein
MLKSMVDLREDDRASILKHCSIVLSVIVYVLELNQSAHSRSGEIDDGA